MTEIPILVTALLVGSFMAVLLVCVGIHIFGVLVLATGIVLLDGIARGIVALVRRVTRAAAIVVCPECGQVFERSPMASALTRFRTHRVRTHAGTTAALNAASDRRDLRRAA